MQYVPGTCIFVLYCILKLLHSQSCLYQSLSWCFRRRFCLFVCLGSNANMTMCALDTRNNRKGDTNAVMSFCNSTRALFFITHSLFYYFTSRISKWLFWPVSSTDGWGLPHYNKSRVFLLHPVESSHADTCGFIRPNFKISIWCLQPNSTNGLALKKYIEFSA